eukprot:TRINITY_DN8912_c0_g2_i4.p1 TRINITY_DN8912_c0_g2~~TRINITY_DN8912_c0_g2_i4.p1  ORF type:complete len:485 (-),score=95.05 TRINITY_DN8912_c0_g2_i4:145-1599(-)
MKDSILSVDNACINYDTIGQQYRIVTLDEGYQLTYGKARYQLLVFIAGFVAMASSMWYVYCIPFFLAFPRVYGCKNGLCTSVDEACKSPTRYYEDDHYNLVTELDLLCRGSDLAIIPSSYPMGFIIGNMILSSAADIFGRLPILVIGQFGMILVMLVMIFFPSYNTCIICTLLCGFFSVASFFPSYSLLYGANHSDRVKLCAAFLAVSAAIAELLVVLFMWTGITWRQMCIVFMIFCALFSIFPIILNESPRFFYSKGQTKFAAKIFSDIAKMNKVELKEQLKIVDTGKSAAKGASCMDKLKLIFEKWVLISIALCGLCFFAAGFVYYGIAFNLEKFGGNIYVNAVVNAVVEIIADILAFVFGYKLGLKRTMIIAFSIMTVGLTCQLVSEWTHQVLASAGLYTAKFGVSAAFTMIYSWAGELFPTAILSTAIGFVGLCDRVGAMISPLVMRVKMMFSLIAISSGIASILIAFLTQHKNENASKL